MRVLDLDEEPFHGLTFLDAAPGGTRRDRGLPLVRGRVDALPAELDALSR